MIVIPPAPPLVSAAASEAATVSCATTNAFAGMAFDTSTNTLYGTTTAAGFLVSIDTGTAAATTIGQYADAAISRFVTGLAYDPITDTLYGMGNDNGFNNDLLITLDRTTGAGTSVGFLGTLGSIALAYDLTSNELFTIDNNTNLLHTIDGSTGAILNSVASVQTHGLASSAVVAEPATLAVFVMALLGLGFSRRFV